LVVTCDRINACCKRGGKKSQVAEKEERFAHDHGMAKSGGNCQVFGEVSDVLGQRKQGNRRDESTLAGKAFQN
jgi:hypothetical protein